jgi:hypothetical protein
LLSIPKSNDEITAAVEERMKNMISTKLTTKLLGVVDDLAMLSPSKGPALDFVVYTLQVLALDETLASEIAALKRVLLGQFSDHERHLTNQTTL